MKQVYHQYFEDMPGYVSVQDRDLRILAANQHFKEDFGEWQGRYCYQVYKHQSEICDGCPVEQTFIDGQSHGHEQQIRTLDGRECAVMIYTSPVRDGSGEITAVIKMSTDISHVKRSQTHLRDSQKRYQQLFDRVPCYISIQDQDLNLVEANQRFKEDFGSYLGCKCFEVYKHRTEECLPCPVQQTFSDGKVHSSEEVVTAQTGEQKHVLVYTTPIFDSMGLMTRVMEMSTDITPIRKLQSQLESIGLLIGSVSHGIKGLLNGLDGGMYLVNTGMKKNDQDRIQKGWEMVQRNVNRIRTQVLNILYYTKERTPGLETVSAVELALDIAKLIEPKAEELNVSLQCNLDKDAGDFEVDPEAVRSLLVNLLENALDACRVDKNKQDHLVSFNMIGKEDTVRFEIKDNGIGMDQETKDKAFSLFFSSKGAKGTGLGLFISNNIIKAHGGRIELDSKPQQGTSFKVIIPRQSAEVNKQTTESTN